MFCVNATPQQTLDDLVTTFGRLVEAYVSLEHDHVERKVAALARYDLIPLAMRPEQDRLQHSTLGDRISQFVDRLFTELHAWLLWVRANPPDLDLTDTAGACRRRILAGCGNRRLAKQGLQSAAQP